jgi:3-hydroxyacyl-[acyl-carrier-protein] dehydratase
MQNIDNIMKMIPHRYPMLLVDRVLEFVPNESAIALKNVTINEPYFPGHFPEKPIMPGVLIVEAMAQAAAAFVGADHSSHKKNLTYLMSIESARFRKPVTPGDSMYLHVSLLKRRGNVWKIKGIAKVEDIIVAEAEFTAMTVNQEDK